MDFLMDIETGIIVNIIDIQQLLQDAIELKRPQHIIELFQSMIDTKEDELKLLESVGF